MSHILRKAVVRRMLMLICGFVVCLDVDYISGRVGSAHSGLF